MSRDRTHGRFEIVRIIGTALLCEPTGDTRQPMTTTSSTGGLPLNGAA